MDFILAILLAILIFLIKAAPLWIFILLIIYIAKQPSNKQDKPDFTFEMDGKTYDAYEVDDDETLNSTASWDD